MAFYPDVKAATETGKPSYSNKSDGGTNAPWYGGKVSAATPAGKEPKGPKQSSGKTTHGRSGGMNIAGKGENLKNMPTVHTGGGTGSLAGVA